MRRAVDHAAAAWYNENIKIREQIMFVGVLDYLEAVLEDTGHETLITRQGGLDILKVRLEHLGKADGTALAEICAVPFTLDGTERTLLQFFTTFAANLDEKLLDKEIAAYNEMNLTLMCGTIGVHKGLKQAYHKYTVVLPADENAEYRQATDSLDLVVGVLNGVFDQAVLIADGRV